MCMPINITLPLEKTEGAITNGQFRDTDNIRHTRNRANNDRITLHRNKNYNPDDNSTAKGNNQTQLTVVIFFNLLYKNRYYVLFIFL
jgi:hypothetical protein